MLAIVQQRNNARVQRFQGATVMLGKREYKEQTDDKSLVFNIFINKHFIGPIVECKIA